MAFDIFKQQRGTAGGVGGRAEFRDAIGDLRYFKYRINFHFDALQFSRLLESYNPLP